MKKFILVFLVVLLNLPLIAKDKITDESTPSLKAGYFNCEKFEADGIWYEHYISETREIKVKVIASQGQKYSGDIVIPENVSDNRFTYTVGKIGPQTFYGCTGLTSISIPNSVTSIEWDAFDGCENLKRVYISDIAAWCSICFNSNNPLLCNSECRLFLNGEEVQGDLVIPDSVTVINQGAFYGCSKLTSITIPNSITRIDINTFYGCTNLKRVYISDFDAWCLIDLGDNPLMSNSECRLFLNGEEIHGNFVIPSTVTTIKYGAFYNCSKISSLTIPNSVTKIEDYAFYGCAGLTSIKIPNSVTVLGWNSFRDCVGLTSIDIPNSVISIDSSAFKNCI